MYVIVTVMMFDRLSLDKKESNNFLLHSLETEHLCSVELFDKNDFNARDNILNSFFLTCHFKYFKTLKTNSNKRTNVSSSIYRFIALSAPALNKGWKKRKG
jgi:hypothetical protein